LLKSQAITRRFFLAGAGMAGAALAASRVAWAANKAPTLLDHILLGCNDLDRGIAFVQEATGVRAVFGGVHPGAGTRNALLSLGENHYLEIIAPDPQQPASADARDLEKLEEPVLVGWAAHPGDIEAFAARLRQGGVAATGPNPGSRKRSDGRVLKWKTLVLRDDAGGLLPFFIEWSTDSLHPSVDSPQGCSLLTFEALTPKPDALWRRATELRLDLPVTEARGPSLHAVIAGPKGRLDVTF
jgi:catechol 2,3-dioxygenase-like lactoylglutathione lyase family enzyme